ncbi:YisL family protein [Bacillus fonticola]|uniref:YisL family protein n=1 Tax=Bacillus fonticola TaxID=2728853 RepID=UPI001D14A93E|nr:YisL family protein [Bacillus fonticola]
MLVLYGQGKDEQLMVTDLHITTWVVGIVLFLVAYNMYKKGNAKAAKINHMITRVLYILIIWTGINLFIPTDPLYNVKALAGILVIVGMELTLVRTKKGKSASIGWGLFIVGLAGALVLGMMLPQGIYLG